MKIVKAFAELNSDIKSENKKRLNRCQSRITVYVTYCIRITSISEGEIVTAYRTGYALQAAL